MISQYLNRFGERINVFSSSMLSAEDSFTGSTLFCHMQLE